jgi:Domain of unknown function (DUF4276)
MIVAIVEGHGDAEAVPVLVRKLLLDHSDFDDVKPHRVHRQKVTKPGELEKVVEFASMREDCTAILVVLDADEDCPATMGPNLVARATTAVGHMPVGVVLANREFEAWILAGIAGARGVRGIAADADAPPDPDRVPSAKSRLQGLMGTRSYLETDDQAALAERLELSSARANSRSFRKLEKEILRIRAQAQANENLGGAGHTP